MKFLRHLQVDYFFLLLVLSMTLFGLIILTSASSPTGYERFGDSYYFLKHQVLYGLVPGLILMTAAMHTPYRAYRKWALPMLGVSIFLLLLVFIPGIGTDHGTFAQSWVQIGGISFQPSEVVKLTFLIYLAAWMEKRGEDIKDVHAGLVPFLVVLGVVSLLILLQPDLGTLSIIVAMAILVYFAAGGPWLHLIGMGAAALALFGVLIKTSPYRAARLMTFLHPELDPQGVGYQINQALLAIGSGGLFGRGYGHSLQKFQYLPEVVGDSIFAVLSEELGFFLTMGFLALLLGMILRGLRIAAEAKDRFGRYLVVGIIGWLGVQAFVNIGAIVGLMPLTGVPLPFLSYGGSSLMMVLAASGIVLNISSKES